MKKIIKIILYLLTFYVVLVISNIIFIGRLTFMNELSDTEYYSPEDIYQVITSQNKTKESAELWRSSEIVNRYKESASELFKMSEIYTEIDNNYLRIIKLMQEGEKYLSEDDKIFLEGKESKFRNRLELLKDTLDVRPKLPTWKSEIMGIKTTQDKYSNFFKNKTPSDSIKLDYSNFNEISNYIVTKDNLIISKLELNQELSEQEINYSLNERPKKMEELIKIFDKINKFISL